MPLAFSEERGDWIMSTHENSLSLSRFSRRSLLMGGGAATLGLFMSRSAQARPVPGFTQDGSSQPPVTGADQFLVDRAWLTQRLAEVKVVALVPADEFAAGHIPGAAQIDWPDLVLASTGDDAIASWHTNVQTVLNSLGVTPADTVVLYDHGTLFSARLFWILDLLGHANVRMLNGGLAAWNAGSGPLETGTSTVSAARSPYTRRLNRAKLASEQDVLSMIYEPNVVMIDARQADEFASAHIPFATNYPHILNAEAGAVPVWKTTEILAATYAGLGITPDKTVIAYCTSGTHSCATYLTLSMLGYPDVRVYSGSWNEWTTNPFAPFQRGTAKDEPVIKLTGGPKPY